MTSMHVERQIKVAGAKGAAADYPAAREFWQMPKRVLIEAALHLAALATGEYDEAMDGEGKPYAQGAVERLREEIDNLRKNDLI